MERGVYTFIAQKLYSVFLLQNYIDIFPSQMKHCFKGHILLYGHYNICLINLLL